MGNREYNMRQWYRRQLQQLEELKDQIPFTVDIAVSGGVVQDVAICRGIGRVIIRDYDTEGGTVSVGCIKEDEDGYKYHEIVWANDEEEEEHGIEEDEYEKAQQEEELAADRKLQDQLDKPRPGEPGYKS